MEIILCIFSKEIWMHVKCHLSVVLDYKDI